VGIEWARKDCYHHIMHNSCIDHTYKCTVQVFVGIWMDFAWGTLVQCVYFPSRQYHGPMKRTWIFRPNFKLYFLKWSPATVLFYILKFRSTPKKEKKRKWQLVIFPIFSATSLLSWFFCLVGLAMSTMYKTYPFSIWI